MGYAMHIGRVGALAVALGIGIAVANTPGTAWAEGASPDSSDSAGDVGASDSPTGPEPTQAGSGAASDAAISATSASASAKSPVGSGQSRPRVIFGNGRAPHTGSSSSAEPVSGGNDAAVKSTGADAEQLDGTAIPGAVVVEDSAPAPQASFLTPPRVHQSSSDTAETTESSPKKQFEPAASPRSSLRAGVASATSAVHAASGGPRLLVHGNSSEPAGQTAAPVAEPLTKSAPTTAPADVAVTQLITLRLTPLASDTPADPPAVSLAALMTLVVLRRQFNQRLIE